MANILNIETSTTVCSVALSCDGEVLEHHEDYDGNNHSTMLSVFLDDIVKYITSREIKLDAVAVSIGPGSYLGCVSAYRQLRACVSATMCLL